MEISAVKLRNSYQTCFVDTNNLFVHQNSLCVVDTEHGIDIGTVVKCKKFQQNPNIEVKGKLLRKITSEDTSLLPEIEEIENRAFENCRKKAKNKNLDMKLISVKCLFDKTKIIFYFVAENRIDFRELVRELASVFRTRIEMRQIGVRDEAKLVGGYGPCGMELCCVHQRNDFEPVSIKMAKEQSLNLNSLKISGMCGRLLCCLGYEYETYRMLNRDLPRTGTEIQIGKLTCMVIHVDTLNEAVQMRSGDRVITVFKNELKRNRDRFTVNPDVIDRIERGDDDTHSDESPN